VLKTVGHTQAGYMRPLCKPKLNLLYFRSKHLARLEIMQFQMSPWTPVMELLRLVMKLLLLVVGPKQNQY